MVPGVREGQPQPVNHLQGDGKADEVHDDVLIGQLNGEDGEGGEEQLKILVDIVFLLTSQVDVAVQLLPMLQRTSEKVRGTSKNIRGTPENVREHQGNIRGSRVEDFISPSS